MNLYEIKNMETGQIVASTVLLKEAAKLLDCPAYAISNAYHSNYAIYGKYKINQDRFRHRSIHPLHLVIRNLIRLHVLVHSFQQSV